MRDYRDTLASQQDISRQKALEYELKENLAKDSLEYSERAHDDSKD